MGSQDVVVVRTGVANLASVLAAMRRAGLNAVVTDDASCVARAGRVVLPGVGSFEAAMGVLRRRALVEPLAGRIQNGRPTLAICLGLHLLGTGSEESPGIRGLQVFGGSARRFDAGVRVPQLGWNRVAPEGKCTWIQPGHAYFANSYRLAVCPAGWRAAWADHGGRFVAAVERDGVLACQFHPELSEAWGDALLRRWIAATASEVVRC